MPRKKMSVHSAKAKGRRLQQWVAEKISNLLNEPWGKDTCIASREMGQNGPDIRLTGHLRSLFPYCVECKYQEKWNIPAWVAQAKENLSKEKDLHNWLLFIKRNRADALVVLDAEVFFQILSDVDMEGK